MRIPSDEEIRIQFHDAWRIGTECERQALLWGLSNLARAMKTEWQLEHKTTCDITTN